MENISIVIIAENLKHDYSVVNMFQQKLVSFLREKFTIINKIYFFSDGAASQFKNRTNFFFLCQFEEDFGFKAEWHFFATSHGKGPCDAIGGTVKRLASKASLQRPFFNQITNAKQLYDWANSCHSAINYIFCSTEEYEVHFKQFTARTKKIKTISGTQSFHAYIPKSKNQIETKVYSFSTKSNIVKLT